MDIDIGGTDIDDIEDEDVFPEEEVVEVEEVDVLEEPEEPIAPSKVPPEAIKKPSPWVKRILVAVVVIVLLIVAIFAFIYFGTTVTNVTVGLEPDPDYDKLNVTVLVGASGMASIAGDADLEIVYQDNVVYTSRVSINDDGTGKAQIPYNSFVEENGDYYFQVKYRGEESPPVIYEERYVVEDLDITADVGKVASGGQLNVTVTMLDESGGMMTPRGAKLTIDEIINIDTDEEIPTSSSPQPVSDSFVRQEYPYFQGGNYSISVILENSRVKSDSDYFTLLKTEELFLNILPIADETHEYTDNIGSYKVEFDAGDSWNDGSITRYIWDFDGDGSIDEDTEDPKTEYTYSKFSSTIGQPQGTYLTTLNVKGDVIEEATGELEIGSKTIKIESP